MVAGDGNVTAGRTKNPEIILLVAGGGNVTVRLARSDFCFTVSDLFASNLASNADGLGLAKAYNTQAIAGRIFIHRSVDDAYQVGSGSFKSAIG